MYSKMHNDFCLAVKHEDTTVTDVYALWRVQRASQNSGRITEPGFVFIKQRDRMGADVEDSAEGYAI